jgi:hypothetical protein
MRSLPTSTKFVVGFFLVFAAASVGCDKSPTTETVDTPSEPVNTVATVNEYCPIMGGKVSEDGGTVEWNDKTIGFCCDGCDEKWLALSDEEKAEKLAAAQVKAESDTGHDDHHGEHEHS